ncbi:MAG: GtrA family protein [Planctomycetes bacterium]|nr:GtrA family protein [Planctomycetota bacterium]
MLTTLVKGKTENTFVQLFRYALVGGIAFLVDFGVLVLLTEWFEVHYLHSAAIAFAMGLTTNYLLSVFWVFETRTVDNHALEFAIFGILGLIGLGLNQFLIYFFTEKVGCHYMVSKGIATGTAFLWNFGSRKLILFSCKRESADVAEDVTLAIPSPVHAGTHTTPSSY